MQCVRDQEKCREEKIVGAAADMMGRGRYIVVSDQWGEELEEEELGLETRLS